MNSSTIQTLKKQGIVTITLAMVFCVAVMAVCGTIFPPAARWLLAIAGVQSLGVFMGLAWALRQSDAIFYAIFVGDMFLRFLVLGVGILVLMQAHIPLLMPLLSLAIGYLVFSVLQIPFLHRMPLV